MYKIQISCLCAINKVKEMKENSTSKRFRTSNKKRQQKIIASLLTGAFFLQQSIMLNTFASEISGSSGNNGVFNIN